MAVDHKRPLPVPPERVEHLSQWIYGRPFDKLHTLNKVRILDLALQGEKVEFLGNINFHLSEAHEIYNQRYR